MKRLKVLMHLTFKITLVICETGRRGIDAQSPPSKNTKVKQVFNFQINSNDAKDRDTFQ